MNEVIRFVLAGSGRRRVVRLCIPGPDRDLPRHRRLNFALGATAIAGVFMQWELHEHGWPFLASAVVGVAWSAFLGPHPLGDHATPSTGQLAGPGDRHARRADHDPGGGRDPLLQRSAGRELAADRSPRCGETSGSRSIASSCSASAASALRPVAALPIEPVRPGHRGGVGERALGSSAIGLSPNRIARINWALGSAIAAVAGILVVPIITLQVTAMTALIRRDGRRADRRLPVVPHRHDRRVRLGVGQALVGRFPITRP